MTEKISEYAFAIGLFFTLYALAFRVALGLYSISSSIKTVCLTLFSYFIFFLLISSIAKPFTTFAQSLLSKGPLIHIGISLVIILWGIYILLTQKTSKPLFRGLLLIPCPACISAIIITLIFYTKYFKISFFNFSLALSLTFSLIVLFNYLLLKFFTKNISPQRKDITISLMMIFTGIYLIGSLIIPSKIEIAKDFYEKNTSTHLMQISIDYLIALVITFILVFILGFLLGRSRTWR